jgi:hypothetical protein
MEYVQITDPRQQGKTSLLGRLPRLLPAGYRVAYLDMESLDIRSEAAWYATLAARLEKQLPDLLDWTAAPRPVDAGTWRDLLLALVTTQRDGGGRRVVIALDEIGALDQPWGEAFFRVLREAFTVREFQNDFRRLSFLLVGAFDPNRLIKDPDISPFNVAQSVHLEDFSPAQLGELAARIGLGPESRGLVEELYEWTEGHPYLVHNLSLYLAAAEPRPGSRDEGVVAAAVEWMLQTDAAHFRGMRRLLEAEPDLITCARQLIIRHGRLCPALNPQHFQLAHVIGVVKPDAEGRCRVRNRVYERSMEELMERIGGPAELRATRSRIRLFVSHSSADADLAKRLAELACFALNLPAEAVRCTSVDGYRLPGGADTDEQLRLEVREAEAFVGIVSGASLESLYVLFELGARWGAERQLLPVIAPGTPAKAIGGPLAGLNALQAESKSQMLQLVEDLGRQLNIRPQSAAAYTGLVDAVIATRPSGPPDVHEAPRVPSARALEEFEIAALVAVAQLAPGPATGVTALAVASRLKRAGFSNAHANTALVRLLGLRFLEKGSCKGASGRVLQGYCLGPTGASWLQSNADRLAQFSE